MLSYTLAVSLHRNWGFHIGEVLLREGFGVRRVYMRSAVIACANGAIL